MRRHLAGLLALAAVSYSGPARAGDASAEPRPHLDLRATPRVAFSPVEVFLMGELKGGRDSEEFYCPGLVWDWGDGSRSAHESDCTPYQDGAHLDRLFSARHAYRAPGAYSVRLFLIRAGRTITMAMTPIMVHGRFADETASGF